MRRRRGFRSLGLPAAVLSAGVALGAAWCVASPAVSAQARGPETASMPRPEVTDPAPGASYWDTADLRIVLDLGGEAPVIEVRGPDGASDARRGRLLAGCVAVGRTRTFFDDRKGRAIEMLDVDLLELLDCAHAGGLLEQGRQLDDETGGGLVFYLGVEGPSKPGVHAYGVRVFNGARLASSVTGAPPVRGLTVVTNQALYVRGDYNSLDKRPATFLADSLNILSNAWNDAARNLGPADRPAAATTVNAAFLARTDGVAGPGRSGSRGGLENFPRFHENWSGTTLTYRGSFGSLGGPLRAEGAR